jgi:hypothetical protein
MNTGLIELLQRIAKEDNPKQALVNYVLEDSKHQTDETTDLYDVVEKIFDKGKRIGYINGRKEILEEINDRFK